MTSNRFHEQYYVTWFMKLDIDGTIVRLTQDSLKEVNTVCKDKCMSTLVGHSAFLTDVEARPYGFY